jgi:hypothetical protein
MGKMEVKSDTYSVFYDTESSTVHWKGSLRLSGTEEYAPIIELLDQAIESQPSILTLNLRDLQFLNSSGISMLSKFAIKVRQKKTIKMIVQGSQNIPWQGKSLKNLQRLMPSLTLEVE